MNKKKKIIIISAITSVIIVVAVVIFAIIWNMPINKFNRAVKQGKINQAVRIYNSSDYDEQYDMSDSILNAIDSYYDAFLNNKITYDDTIDFLNMVEHIEDRDIYEKITNVNNKLNVLYESKKSYSAAVNAYNEENYAYAYVMYNKVIYEDTFFDKASEGAKNSKKEYISQILSKVEEYKAAGDYSKAVNQIINAMDIIGKNTSLDDELENCRNLLLAQNVDNSIKQADIYISAGNFVDAIRMLEDEKDTYNDEKLISKLVECCSLYADSVINNINSAFAEERYSDAISEGSTALDVIKNISEADESIENITSIMKNVYVEWKDGYIEAEDYGSAIKVLDDALNTFPNDTVLAGNRQDCVNAYLNNVIAAANSAVENRDLELAINVCNIAYEVVGYDERLVSEYEYIDSMQPIYLDELTPVNYDSNMWPKWTYGVTLTDTLGNTYDDYKCAIRLGMYESNFWQGTSQAEYYLGKEYRTISGEIAPEDKTSTQGQCRLVIYADDVCVYRSEPITRKSTKMSFTVDIAGADFIKIVCEGINGYNSCYFYLINPKLEK